MRLEYEVQFSALVVFFSWGAISDIWNQLSFFSKSQPYQREHFIYWAYHLFNYIQKAKQMTSFYHPNGK